MFQLNIKISNSIYISLNQLDSEEEWVLDLKKFCQEQLNFYNPKMIELQRMGFSTWGTPKYINCFKELKTSWVLPAGFLETLADYCHGHDIELKITDQRTTNLVDNINCKITPKPEQQAILEKLLAYDRAILEAKPGFGKTMAALLYFAARSQKTLVIVHTRSLLQQWVKRIRDYFVIADDEVGVIGEGKWRIGTKITIASYQTLLSRGIKGIESEFGLVIIDECHHVPAQTFTKIARGFKAHYYLGLSATPFRKDKLDRLMNFYIGHIVISADVSQDDDQGLSFMTTQNNLVLPADKTHLLIRQTKFYVDNPDTVEFVQLGTLLVEDFQRNELILNDAIVAIARGAKGLILSERVGHCENLYNELKKRLPGLKIGLITGQVKKKEREQFYDDVRAEKYQFLVATGSVIGEGFDWPSINHLFLTYPFSWKGKLIQYAGRAQRLSPEKKEAFIYDYVDSFVPMLKAMYRRRVKAYQELGIKPLAQ